MRTHRFIINESLAIGTLSVRDFELRNQLKNVLRFTPGDAVTLCDGKGKDARAIVVEYGASTVEFSVDEVTTNDTESRVRVTLYCAVLKRENFELVTQKATEAGVARIVPVVTQRTVKTGVRSDRLQKIAKEAAEQSGRGIVPPIEEPMSFKDALADASALSAHVIFELGGTTLDAKAVLSAATKNGSEGLLSKKTVGVFVGPEGGWAVEEVDACRDKGFVVASMGPRTLRAETAAVIATYLFTTADEASS